MRFISLFFVGLCGLLSALPMTTDFQRAQEMAKAYQKPLAIVFTANEWEEDDSKALSAFLADPAFAEEMGNECIFAHLDYSASVIPSKEVVMNHYAKEEYHVEAFPTVVLVDPDTEEMSRTGYFPISAREYALHLKTKIQEHAALTASTSEDHLALYLRAKKLGCKQLEHKFIHAGLEAKRDPELVLEAYARLGKRGEHETEEAQEFRSEILAKGSEKTRERLAMLDYQLHGDISLVEKLAFSSHADWRLHVLVAEHYIQVGNEKKARQFAHKAAAAAPDYAKVAFSANVEEVFGNLKEKTGRR